jgi:hypothetical protein
MRVTWKDGVSTLATAGIVVLERAHFHDWNWPLVSSVRWALVGIVALGAISFIFGYLLDEQHTVTWTPIAITIGIIALILAGIGLVVATSDYVILLMLATIAFWVAAMVRHVASPSHGPA